MPLRVLLAAAVLLCAAGCTDAEPEPRRPAERASQEPVRTPVARFATTDICDALDDELVDYFVGADRRGIREVQPPRACNIRGPYGGVDVRVVPEGDALTTLRQGVYPFNQACPRQDLGPEWDSAWTCTTEIEGRVFVTMQRAAPDSGLVCTTSAHDDEQLVITASRALCEDLLRTLAR